MRRVGISGKNWKMTLEKDPQRIEGRSLLILHALRTSCPVTIMKVKALALEDECANAIL